MTDPRDLLKRHGVQVAALLGRAAVPGALDALCHHLETPGLLDAMPQDPADPVAALAEQVGFWACGVAGDGEAADRLEAVLAERVSNVGNRRRTKRDSS